jgi:TetR/AcrR family transcriptional regulator, cholesterol catabolism regulator
MSSEVPEKVRPRQSGELTASRLVALAARQFRSKGFHATTTRELAASLGIKKSSLYYHVSSKDDLLYSICVESLTRIRKAAEEALKDAPPPAEAVERLIAAHVRAMLEDRDMHATMLVELRALSGPRRDEVIIMRSEYEALVEQTLGTAQEAGTLTKEFAPRELTLALLNLLNWTIFWYHESGVDTPDRLVSLFSSIFLDGTAPGKPADS